MRALDALELHSDAEFAAIKAAHRRLVKEAHPDANPATTKPAKRFKQVQAAYDVLEESRRTQRRQGGRSKLPRLHFRTRALNDVREDNHANELR